MAWTCHYQVPFQAKNGDQYNVYIYEQGYSGQIVTLQGADEPFVTQEDNTDDIFTPIRKQSGYLRVVDTDGTLLEALMPENNTEKRVILFKGTYVNGIFTPLEQTDAAIKWQGFIQAQAYTQPWGENARVLEFPIKSFLASLDNVTMSGSITVTSTRLAKLLTDGFTALIGTEYPFGDVYMIGDLYASYHWMTLFLPWIFFYSEDTYENEGDTQTQWFGRTYYDALSAVLRLFGLTAREEGYRLYFSHFDNAGGNYNLHIDRYTWMAIQTMATGGTIQYSSIGNLDDSSRNKALPDSMTYEGNESKVNYIPGGKTAKVVLQMQGQDNTLKMTLPATTEDDSEVKRIQNIGNGIAYVQAHSPRVSSLEVFSFFKYMYRYEIDRGATTNNWYWYIDYDSTSNYTTCRDQTVIYLPLFSPRSDISHEQAFYVGAFPCRWFHSTDNASAPLLENGLFMNQIFRQVYVGEGAEIVSAWKIIYNIKSQLVYKLTGGYIHIDFNLHSFINWFLAAPDSNRLFVDQMPPNLSALKYKMYVMVEIGGYYWNGSEWTTTAGGFPIDIDTASIVSNKTSDITIDMEGGWFIPVNRVLEGQLNFSIHERVDRQREESEYAVEAHSRIMTDLVIQHLETRPITASSRNKNTYRQTILNSGFNSDKAITLEVGTYNNNIFSYCFIRNNAAGAYIQAFKYILPSSGESVERPENHLLKRMATYYSVVRRAFSAIIGTPSFSIYDRLFIYENRNFMAIDAKHEWREDRQKIKFIEVTK